MLDLDDQLRRYGDALEGWLIDLGDGSAEADNDCRRQRERLVATGLRSRSLLKRHRVLVAGTVGVAVLGISLAAIAMNRGPDSGRTVSVAGIGDTYSWSRLDSGPLTGGRQGAVEVTAGSELFVWGGAPNDSDERFDSGAVFDPRTERWTEVPPAPIAGRRDAVGVWTGSEVLVWGGDSRTDGAAYDPASRAWRILPRSPLGGSQLGGAVWTGSEMVVVANDGSVAYDPAQNAWRDLGKPGLAIAPNTTTSVVWTGDVVVVVAGSETAQLAPSTTGWVRGADAPLVPNATSAAWDGRRVVAVSYYSVDTFGPPEAAAYDATTQTWTALPDLPLALQECGPALTANGAVLIAGYCDQAAIWDSTTQQWLPLDLPTDRGQPGGPYLLRPGLVAAEKIYFWGEGTFWALSARPAQPDEAARPLFSTATHSTMLFSDGGVGAVAIDLDSQLVARRPIEGERPGDQPFRLSITGADLVVGWGEIYAVPLAGGPSRKIADATIYIPAAEPDEVWTFDWSGGRIGQGDLTVRRVRVDGTVVFESRAFDDQLFFPLLGVPAGLLVQAPQGVRVWDAETQDVGPLLGPGQASAVSSDGSSAAWCESNCEVPHVVSLERAGSPTPTNANLGDAIALSPDGSHVGYVDASGDSITLVALDLAAGRRVEQNVAERGSLQWTRDGQQLFYTDGSWQQPQTTLGRFDLSSDRWEMRTIDIGGLLAPVVIPSSEATAFVGTVRDVARSVHPGASNPVPDSMHVGSDVCRGTSLMRAS